MPAGYRPPLYCFVVQYIRGPIEQRRVKCIIALKNFYAREWCFFLYLGTNFHVILNSNMPTILIVGPYRFFFYSSDAPEPVHVHVQSGNSSAKFWVNPARLHSSKGYNEQELGEILKIVKKHKGLFERKWHEYFSS